MTSELEVFDARLQALKPQLEAANAKAERARQEWDTARELLAAVQAQYTLLQDLRRQIVAVSTPKRLRRPTTAILNLVSQRPGITQTEILDQLEGVIDTVSSNARHILRTTLANLVKAGKLLRHDGDLYSVPGKRS